MAASLQRIIVRGEPSVSLFVLGNSKLTQIDARDFCAIAAVNEPAILEACLARSPDISSGRLELNVQLNAHSATQAYNRGFEQTQARFCIFVHQDVYLPAGWLDKAIARIEQLTREHPDWVVAGPYGIRPGGDAVGRVWDVNLRCELGHPGFPATAVGSLDELLLICRRASGYRFDENLRPFHMYGVDIVQSALAMGGSAWAIEVPVVHNNRPTTTLRGGYAEAYMYMRRKWRRNLPIHTTVATISAVPISLWRRQWGVFKARGKRQALLADSVRTAQKAKYE